MSASRRPWRERGLAFATLAFSIFLLEVGLRFLAPESFLRPQTPMKLGFLHWNAFRGIYLTPDYEQPGVSINSAGRRGPPLDETRPRRIVCLGDSSTFGVWAGGTANKKYTRFDSYPAMLATKLEERGYKDWQVINAGVPGSHAGHSLRILRREILALKPEIVTLRVGVNDHSRQALPWIDDPESPALRRLFYALGQSRLFMMTVELHHRLTVDPALVGRVMPPDSFRRSLETLIKESRANGFRLLLVDYPLRAADASDSTAHNTARFYGDADVDAFYAVHSDYQRVLGEVAEEQAVPLLITAPTLGDESAPGFNIDLIHPDRRGMRQTADLLFEELERKGWLD